MDDPPGRDTELARSHQRRTWYGHGQLTRVEKGGINRFLHDLTYTFADVSVFGLPAIYLVFLAAGTGAFGGRAVMLVAWVTMTITAAAIRGGWITPLGTETPGWVSFSPLLAVVRLLYYNFAIATTVAASLLLAESVGSPPSSLGFTVGIAFVTTMAFPRVAEAVYRRISD